MSNHPLEHVTTEAHAAERGTRLPKEAYAVVVKGRGVASSDNPKPRLQTHVATCIGPGAKALAEKRFKSWSGNQLGFDIKLFRSELTWEEVTT